jgi:asparagine synthase (glutamine-hydrolysing)
MPGITGLITKHVLGNEKEKVDAMLRCMLHEPFYVHGNFQSPENGFYLGFSALEKSFADCMPVYNEKKDIVLFLTGETYHDLSEIHALKYRGHNFNPHNASCLVHMYEEEGEELFKNLNGWFNGIIMDMRNPKIILFNDRCGIRRIYYHENEEIFAFSSEAKSLLKAFPELREISFQSVGEVLTFDCVLDNRTYFPKIDLLPPCSSWTFREGRIIKKVYIDSAELENQSMLPTGQFVQKLEETFVRILPRYFANGSVGLGLTGGLDTRLILACLKPEPGQLPCYTFGGTFRDIFDVRLAPKVAAACGQSHTVLRLDDKQLLRDYPHQVEKTTYISDGLESTDKTDALYFNRMAREIAPVRMTGKYGSQVMKGIFGFAARLPYMHLIREDFKQYLDLANKTRAGLQKAHKLTLLLRSAIPWWWNAFVTLESSYVEVRSPFLDNDFVKVLYQAPPLDAGFGTKFELDLIAKTKPDLMAIPTTGSYGGNKPWPISYAQKTAISLLIILDKIYIRERVPFNMTHVVARADHLLVSPLRLDRLIMGFTDFRRYRSWFRDELSGYLQDILLDQRTLNRPYWSKKALIKFLDDHISGRGTYLREIRKVLQMELTHRCLLENI